MPAVDIVEGSPVLLFGFELTRTGLRAANPHKKPTHRQWTELGEFLAFEEQALQWQIGDWVTYGELHFGEVATQEIAIAAGESTGWKLETVKQCAWVAREVPAARRVPTLSFSHHREVADLPAPDQTKWLTKAKQQDWSVDKLRRSINHATHPEKTECWLLVRCQSETDREKLSKRLQGEGRSVKLP